jgi:hypothetical protein
MNALSVKELREKLVMIDSDLAKLRSEAGSDRKLQVLSEYREYIYDEIKMLENESK